MSRDERGITILEVLVVSTVMLVVGVGAVGFVRSQSLAMQTGAGQMDLDDTARGVIEFMTREIRMAGYNPRCLNPSPVIAVAAADLQELRLQYDRNENGVLDATTEEQEEVRYYYHQDSQTLRRVVGQQTSVLAQDVPQDGFQLRYFGTDGVELTAQGAGGLSPLQRAAVYEITILFAPAKSPDTRVAQELESELWTGVALRNRDYACQ